MGVEDGDGLSEVVPLGWREMHVGEDPAGAQSLPSPEPRLGRANEGEQRGSGPSLCTAITFYMMGGQGPGNCEPDSHGGEGSPLQVSEGLTHGGAYKTIPGILDINSCRQHFPPPKKEGNKARAGPCLPALKGCHSEKEQEGRACH